MKEVTRNICLLCFVITNSVLLNLLVKHCEAEDDVGDEDEEEEDNADFDYLIYLSLSSD